MPGESLLGKLQRKSRASGPAHICYLLSVTNTDYAYAMRIELRDVFRRHMGIVEVDPTIRPSRARLSGEEREVFLNWDTALDDASCLRRCLSCGCTDLFREKAFPPIMVVLVILNYAGLLLGIFGFAESIMVQFIMIILLMTGLVVLLRSRMRLVCYHCRTAHYDLPLARYHRSWDRAIADRHPALDSSRLESGDEEETDIFEEIAPSLSHEETTV